MSGKGVQSGGESSVKAVVKPTRCPHRGKKGHLHRPFLAPTLWEVATRASQRNRRKMEDRWATATRQGASRHADALVCVTAGSTTTLPARTGSNIDHAVVGTTPGGTLHQVGYKTLGDEAAAQEEPSKRPGRLTAERQRRSKAKRTLASSWAAAAVSCARGADRTPRSRSSLRRRCSSRRRSRLPTCPATRSS